jgi:hypothetical protein
MTLSRDFRVGSRVRVRDGVGVICKVYGPRDSRRLLVRLPDGAIRQPLAANTIPYRRRQRERVVES